MAIFFAMGTSTRLSTQRFCAWQHGDGSDVLTACCSDTALLILSSPIKMKAELETKAAGDDGGAKWAALLG